MVFPLLASATASRTHHQDPSTGGDRLPCARSWAYHEQRYVEQRPLFAAPSCAAKHDQDVEEAFTQKRVYVCAGEWRSRRKNSGPGRRSPPGGVLRAAALKAHWPFPSRLARHARLGLLTHRHDRKQQRQRLRGWEGTLSQTRGPHGCLIAGGAEGCMWLHGGAQRPQPRRWERGGARQRLGGNHRGKPTEDG
ncbi:uncharacterized protein GJ701_016628 isoform 2-T2 [Geothlypis trichas]